MCWECQSEGEGAGEWDGGTRFFFVVEEIYWSMYQVTRVTWTQLADVSPENCKLQTSDLEFQKFKFETVFWRNGSWGRRKVFADIIPAAGHPTRNFLAKHRAREEATVVMGRSWWFKIHSTAPSNLILMESRWVPISRAFHNSAVSAYSPCAKNSRSLYLRITL